MGDKNLKMYLNDDCSLNTFSLIFYQIKTSQLICAANQLVKFSMSGVVVINSLYLQKNKPSNLTEIQR